MKPKRNPKDFPEIIARFAAGVREAFNDPIWDSQEEQLKNPVREMLGEVGELFGWKVASQSHAPRSWREGRSGYRSSYRWAADLGGWN